MASRPSFVSFKDLVLGHTFEFLWGCLLEGGSSGGVKEMDDCEKDVWGYVVSLRGGCNWPVS
jgi:hypothetical protein